MDNLPDKQSIADSDRLIQQYKEEKNYTECLALIENNIVLKAQVYGKESPEFLKTAKDLCELCNLIALSFLRQNKKEEGLSYLLKAEKLFLNYKELLSLCYNNIGCYYKFIGNYSQSFRYLSNALAIAYQLKDKKKSAEVHLNTSTILSQVGKYKLAIEQCLNCTILLQEHLNDSIEKMSDEELKEILTILILSYQNLAVLHENMNNFPQALLFYQIAQDLCEKNKKRFPNFNGNVVDEVYKLRLLVGMASEKSENLDKLGQHFNKMLRKNLKDTLENKNKQQDLEDTEHREDQEEEEYVNQENEENEENEEKEMDSNQHEKIKKNNDSNSDEDDEEA